MKKWILFSLLFLVILVIAGIYIFIPPTSAINTNVTVNSTPHAANRLFVDKANWVKWWPAQKNQDSLNNNDTLFHNEFAFIIRSRFYNGLIIDISTDGLITNSTLTIAPLDGNSLTMNWNTVLKAGSNPLRRIRYRVMKEELAQAMNEILASMKQYFDKTENIYGLSIREEKVKDTLLVSTRAVLNDASDMTEVYSLINRLRAHISKHGGKETNAPMLNMYLTGDKGNETMVAIPVDREIPETSDIGFKRMIDGNILVAEAKGGPYSIQKAFLELENYVSDYRLVSPAIPFASLVTDRIRETDTSRWVTRIYYPIF